VTEGGSGSPRRPMPDLVVPRDLQRSLRKDEAEHDATRLVFTAFIDSHTTGGHGLVATDTRRRSGAT
jgi:N-acetylglucosamine-6-phosphate deacetylase